MQIKLRKIKESDLMQIAAWRISPEVTRYMNTDPVLTMEDQQEWFAGLEKLTIQTQWMIEIEDKPVGVISLSNIDVINKRCNWGYYIAEKKMRSLQLAISLEASLYDYVFDIMSLNKISGESFCVNRASIKMHELCGCKEEGILREHILKNNQFYDVCIQSMFAIDWKQKRTEFDYIKIKFMEEVE